MPTYKLAWKASTKEARILENAASIPAGFTNAGSYVHEDSGDPYGNAPVGADDTHVHYQHVQNILYQQGQLDMQVVKVLRGLTTFTATPTPKSIVAGTDFQIVHTFTPANANNQTVTYVSSDPTKATVSATGLVHGVAAGTANITCTSADNATTKVVAVTVTAS